MGIPPHSPPLQCSLPRRGSPAPLPASTHARGLPASQSSLTAGRCGAGSGFRTGRRGTRFLSPSFLGPVAQEPHIGALTPPKQRRPHRTLVRAGSSVTSRSETPQQASNRRGYPQHHGTPLIIAMVLGAVSPALGFHCRDGERQSLDGRHEGDNCRERSDEPDVAVVTLPRFTFVAQRSPPHWPGASLMGLERWRASARSRYQRRVASWDARCHRLRLHRVRRANTMVFIALTYPSKGTLGRARTTFEHHQRPFLSAALVTTAFTHEPSMHFLRTRIENHSAEYRSRSTTRTMPPANSAQCASCSTHARLPKPRATAKVRAGAATSRSRRAMRVQHPNPSRLAERARQPKRPRRARSRSVRLPAFCFSVSAGLSSDRARSPRRLQPLDRFHPRLPPPLLALAQPGATSPTPPVAPRRPSAGRRRSTLPPIARRLRDGCKCAQRLTCHRVGSSASCPFPRRPPRAHGPISRSALARDMSGDATQALKVRVDWCPMTPQFISKWPRQRSRAVQGRRRRSSPNPTPPHPTPTSPPAAPRALVRQPAFRPVVLRAAAPARRGLAPLL